MTFLHHTSAPRGKNKEVWRSFGWWLVSLILFVPASSKWDWKPPDWTSRTCSLLCSSTFYSTLFSLGFACLSWSACPHHRVPPHVRVLLLRRRCCKLYLVFLGAYEKLPVPGSSGKPTMTTLPRSLYPGNTLLSYFSLGTYDYINSTWDLLTRIHLSN